MSNVCLTVDVEDWYDGMAVLGQPIPRPEGAASGLSGLGDLLQRVPDARVTLFVVGDYAPRVREELVELIRRGHEVASHGPDHGRLPTRGPGSKLAPGGSGRFGGPPADADRRLSFATI